MTASTGKTRVWGLSRALFRNIHQCLYGRWHLVFSVMTHLIWVEWMVQKLSAELSELLQLD